MAEVRMSEEHRVKIRNSNILNALIEHAEGRREMSGTQVTAALGLLKKALPDLSSVTIAGDDEKPLRLQMLERVIVDPHHPNGKSVPAASDGSTI